jgi:hypothetical protein
MDFIFGRITTKKFGNQCKKILIKYMENSGSIEMLKDPRS